MLVVKNLSASAGDVRDAGSIPEWGRFLGERNGNPLQHSCLENSMDRGAWRAAVHGITKSQTQLKWLSSNGSSHSFNSHNNPRRYTLWFSLHISKVETGREHSGHLPQSQSCGLLQPNLVYTLLPLSDAGLNFPPGGGAPLPPSTQSLHRSLEMESWEVVCHLSQEELQPPVLMGFMKLWFLSGPPDLPSWPTCPFHSNSSITL